MGTAYLTSAAIAEEHFDIDTAAGEYRKYLSLPPAQQELSPKETYSIKSKEILISWLSGHPNVLKETQLIRVEM